MPNLLTFGACRQAIVDRDGGSVSLINLINTLTILKQPDQNISPDANSPIEWGVVTAWLRLNGEEGKTFLQHHLLISPDGRTAEGGETNFSFDPNIDSRIMTTVIKANGFPVGQTGIVTLRVELREEGNEQWETIADYPIEIRHQIQEGNLLGTG